jgi:hypothetical protein
MRKRRKRSINRFFIIGLLLCGMAVAGNKKKPAEEQTLVAGQVFHEPGLALPDATVTLLPAGDLKKKLAQQITSPRGEFVFRVPAKEAKYVVKVTAKGWKSEEKEAQVTGLDRVDLTFNLQPELKK